MKLATRLDESPWDAVHRVIIGWLIYSALARFAGEEASVWAWTLSFLAVLLALRIVPAVIRKALPFSSAAQAVWSARRQMAKRYDSYQWQKLFWIGLGMAVHLARSKVVHAAPLALTSACLVSGAVGFVIWRNRRSHLVPLHATDVQRARGIASTSV